MTEEFDPREYYTPEAAPKVDFSDVVQLKSQKQELRESIIQSSATEFPSHLQPKAAAIFGPEGAGKRRLLRSTLGELGNDGYQLLQVTSLHRGRVTPAKALEGIFEVAIEEQPIALHLDCIDDVFSDDVIRMFKQLLKQIRLQGDDIIILSSIETDELHGYTRPYIRQMDLVVEIETPDLNRRQRILEDRLKEAGADVNAITPDEYDFRRLARETDRFSLQELERTIRRLSATALNRQEDQPLSESTVVRTIDQIDTERVEKLVDKETLTDVDIPDVTFDDVGGHVEAKRRLREQVKLVFSDHRVDSQFGVEFGNGISLHGPPGTGKTMLIRALANELDHTFIPVNSSLLKGNGQASSAQLIPSLFYRAQRNAPAILFFDEFDLLGTERGTPGDEVTVNTLLTELDGVQQLDQVIVIAATNRPEVLDPALLRPGRFDYHLEIDRPNTDVQATIFETHSDGIPLAANVTPEWFAEMTDNVTGADIAAICERAVTIGLRQADIEEMQLSRDEFEEAYSDFKEGRLMDEDLSSSPAFQ